MVRLLFKNISTCSVKDIFSKTYVFRPHTQIWRSICTSEPLRTSTRVSSGFILFTHSSPSFGS